MLGGINSMETIYKRLSTYFSKKDKKKLKKVLTRPIFVLLYIHNLR